MTQIHTRKADPVPLCSLYPYWLAVQLQAAGDDLDEIDRLTDKLAARGFAYPRVTDRPKFQPVYRMQPALFVGAD
jgi:hypothetical protein